MPIFEIVNPSDKYTIECSDQEIAAVCCVLLGEGQYAFEPISEATIPGVPMFLFGGSEKWFEDTFGSSADDVLGSCLADRRSELAAAFDSVIIGNRDAFMALAPVDKESPAYAEARAKWHDVHRSSMNDIGGRAYAYAKKLRSPAAPSPRSAPRQIFVNCRTLSVSDQS